MSQLDMFSAKVDRDQALDQVAENAGDFMTEAFEFIRKLQPGEYTGEDIRLTCQHWGIEPHHHNAWGALIVKCIKAGVLRNTGRREHMKSPKSHARKTDVYVK